jgi:uncharacterized protein YeaC (DUF1315 family)
MGSIENMEPSEYERLEQTVEEEGFWPRSASFAAEKAHVFKDVFRS